MRNSVITPAHDPGAMERARNSTAFKVRSNEILVIY